jgi:gamma-glutamyltranspeptidase/glutathione hydrolase
MRGFRSAGTLLREVGAAALFLGAGSMLEPLAAADRLTDRGFAMRSPVIATHGMVASAHPLATRIGVEILEAGGTAVDAAIAVDAALGLMEPIGCGVGGDLFAIVWDAKTQRLYGLNGSGRAGSALKLEDLRQRGLTKMPELGGLPVTVPGAVDGCVSSCPHAFLGPSCRVVRSSSRRRFVY